MHQHAVSCIVPPHILKNIATKGTESQKKLALATLKLSTQMSGQRQALTDFNAAMNRVEGRGKERIVYDAQHGSTLPGIVVRAESDLPNLDVAVNEAFDGSGITYDLFQDVYRRNSIDDKGMRIETTVHYHRGYGNAFWSGEQMVCGDGDEDLPAAEQLFNRFTIAIDAIGHELTHGITQFEAKLNYNQQPGALNESMSDIFGSLVKQYHLHQTAAEADWLIGAGLLTANVNGVGIRCLKAPGTAYDDPILGKDPQPAHMRDYVNTISDNGGVHINSGIPNHAFYLVATELGGFAWEKAGQIWYVSLRDKLSANSNFQNCADLTYQTAGELFGAGSLEQQAVQKGWAEVGLTVGNVPDVPGGSGGLLGGLLRLLGAAPAKTAEPAPKVQRSVETPVKRPIADEERTPELAANEAPSAQDEVRQEIKPPVVEPPLQDVPLELPADAPLLAGYSSDDAVGKDRLGISADVDAFSKVLIAKEVEPPICLGLFGDWGSGKSFFMNKMQSRITDLAKRAQETETAGRPTAYCSNVVQISFNAWHYVDADLWASMISHIFDELGRFLSDKEKKVQQIQLFQKLESAKTLLLEATQAKENAEHERVHAESELEKIQRTREERSIDLKKLRAKFFQKSLKEKKELQETLNQLSEQTGITQSVETAEDLQEILSEMRTLQGRVQATLLTLVNAPDRGVRIALLLVILVLVPALPAIINYLASLRGVQEYLSSAAILVTQVTTFITGMTLWLSNLLKKTSSLVNQLESAKTQVDDIVKASRADPSTEELNLLKEISGLREREEAAKKSLLEAQQRLDRAQLAINQIQNISDGRTLSQFVQERISQEDYRKRLGIISIIRRDLKSLSDLLAASSSPDKKTDQQLPNIDRIILYVDDLDRCHEERVVEVLQAIHLLLAFRLFVVVVGVDSRWLLHSLQKAYPALQETFKDKDGLMEDERLAWETTPQNYLEKIFQIPYNLQGMDRAGFGKLVDSILLSKEETLPVAAPSSKPAEPSEETKAGEDEPQPPVEVPNAPVEATPPAGPGMNEHFNARSVAAELEALDKEFPDGLYDQTPRLLAVEYAEKQFITCLHAMIPTPRAAKRFINIYRLIRAKLKLEELPGFLGKDGGIPEYISVMVLLGILIGFQRGAPHVFRKIMASDQFFSWQKLVDSLLPRRHIHDTTETYYNGLLPSISKADAAEWKRLYLALKGLQGQLPPQDLMAAYRKWVPTVVKFSFRLGKVFSYINTPPEIRITHIDLDLENKRNEFVTIENFGDMDQDMTGWMLRDQAQHEYRFPRFTLVARGRVNVWVRSGADTEADLYWGKKIGIWNNSGDSAYLLDSIGNVVANFTIDKV